MRQSLVRKLIAGIVSVSLIAPSQVIEEAAHAAAPAPFTTPHAGALTPERISALNRGANQRMIVMLRGHGSASRASVLSELRRLGVPGLRSLALINAVTATMSPAEVARLRANPLVASILPDQVIQLRRSGQAQAAQPTTASRAGLLSTSASQQACSQKPSLEPEALQLTHAASNNPGDPQAQRLISGTGKRITGSGVKVAWIADGIDINNPDFIRPAHSPYGKAGRVFVDYKDFSGDGATAPTTGGEAFIDASSIGAQGRRVYDVNHYLIQPNNGPCNIRILGMAPGAEMVGLKVFGQTNATSTSAFVQAIDYAVNVDHVNVINESFGGNPFPDLSGDPISLANDAAVAAGVTVVVSSGDAGVSSTLGSPATDPNVIAVGASTQFRWYSQTNASGFQLGKGGYLDNNISDLSSGGFSQIGPRTVDVVAPGDLSWALCTPTDTNPPAYSDCTDENNNPSPIEEAGGTSEAAPLTAGEAALVIQAYRSTHHGLNPTPDVIKQIIMSTATDLGIPATEQGAGLINSYRAVQAALSFRDPSAHPTPRASSLLINQTTAYSATALPGTPESFSVTVANIGAGRQLVAPRVRTLGKSLLTKAYTLYLDPLSDSHIFYDQAGVKRAYVEQDFTVPVGIKRLHAAIAWLAGEQPSSIVRLDLFDPTGRFVAFSQPQIAGPTSSGYGQASVRNPSSGRWRAIIWTIARATTASYHGAVQLSLDGQAFVSAGTVSPSALVIAPGHNGTFTVRVHTPASPGDRDYEVVFPSPSGRTSLLGAVPITLRTLVRLGRNGAAFSGTLLGGNGRGGAPGQTLSYQFDVPAGLHDLDLGLSIRNPDTNLEGVLIEPNGQPIDVQTMVGAVTNVGLPNFYTGTMQFFRRDPQPGRWLFTLLINDTIGGSATSQTFQATIGFNQVTIKSQDLPSSPKTFLSAGKSKDAEILIGNFGLTTKNFFIDPRLNTLGPVPLQAPYSYSVTLPITASQQLPVFAVPPEVSELDLSAQSPTPVGLDVATGNGASPFGGTGSPEVYQSSGPLLNPTTGVYSTAISIHADEVTPGVWSTSPEEIGPFPNEGAPPSTVEVRAVAYGQPFDRTVASSTGDLWSPFAAAYHPMVVSPGHEGFIRVRITPRGIPGTVVQGFLYVDTFDPNSTGADELLAIPYTYTIGSK
ncbi:MAG TPA: S8 family serine peptidase [Chloroflexota bacterium]|nr:S8 family serine peptidase [Chloroflexota bacterium]